MELLLICIAGYFIIGVACASWLCWLDGEWFSWKLVAAWPVPLFLFACLAVIGIVDRWQSKRAMKNWRP